MDLGPRPDSSQEKQHTRCVTESSLSLAYFVLMIGKKETVGENFHILQFQVGFCNLRKINKPSVKRLVFIF